MSKSNKISPKSNKISPKSNKISPKSKKISPKSKKISPKSKKISPKSKKISLMNPKFFDIERYKTISRNSFENLKSQWFKCAGANISRFTRCRDEILFNRFFNEEYKIDIIGMQQPDNLHYSIFSDCLLILKNNVKYYISFNGFLNDNPENEKVALTEIEKSVIKEKFIHIPVEDYKPPTEQDLRMLWVSLNNFHLKKIEKPELNLIMHCTCGFGRTGTMIMSILMYKMSFDPKWTDSFNYSRRILSSQLPDIEKFEMLIERSYIKYLMTEIRNFSNMSYKEIFCDDSKTLLIERFNIIIKSILNVHAYMMSNS